jgi:hypothetical protein
MTSYLELSVPEFVADSHAIVTITDHGLNPWACRRKTGAAMGGFMSIRFELTREAPIWRIVKREMEWSGTTVCGFSPEEEARIARLEREDSLLREIISPMAGTYRVVVLFGSGDSSVVFTRTELHPRSSIRDRRQQDAGEDEYRPINGYYLATCSAGSTDSIPASFGPCLQSYYAVSLEPIVTKPESTTWHGEIDPLVEITFLDSRASVRNEAQQLFGASEKTRDPEWYFMPGTWITYQDGHVRYEWTIKQGRELAYKVRAERISDRTLNSR